MGNKHSKTHDHQHQQAHQKVDNLKSLESKAAPWISFGKLQQLSAHETSDYYKKVSPSSPSLRPPFFCGSRARFGRSGAMASSRFNVNSCSTTQRVRPLPFRFASFSRD